MASPGLPEGITAGVTTGHVTDHEKIHDLLNEFDMAAQAEATGDLLVFQDGLIKRLPVGSDNQVLTADSGEPAGVKWATPTGGGGGGDGRTLIDEVELESAQSQIVFTDIPQTFQDLEIVGYLRSARSTTATGIGIRFGPSAGLDTGNNYTTRYLASGVSGSSGVGNNIGVQAGTAASATAGRFGALRARVVDYRRTGERLVFAEGYSIERLSVGAGSWISADPLEQIALFDRDTGDNLVAGSRVLLYGLP